MQSIPDLLQDVFNSQLKPSRHVQPSKYELRKLRNTEMWQSETYKPPLMLPPSGLFVDGSNLGTEVLPHIVYTLHILP